ncbi:MAG TPA: 6-carboxytetrahydropterin synthase [Planctomycetota bacterium]|nr:6-carboxytetrahydropterin synthase [Planctomycetota bacterium]
MKVGVRGHFDSMHSLPGHPKCGVPHGHTYVVEAQVEGEPVGGIVVDFDALKSALREVLAPFDHADLNRLIRYPSCEAIAMEIHHRLKLRMEGRKVAVRVWEGEGKWAEFEA